MTTAWSYLPNAAHIDRVLASVKAHPEEWIAARRSPVSVSDASWAAAWDAARFAPRAAARVTAWPAAWLRPAAARGAIVALVVWDHSVQYLDMSSDRLKVWHALSEDPACILLLPAVVAFERIKELELA